MHTLCVPSRSAQTNSQATLYLPPGSCACHVYININTWNPMHTQIWAWVFFQIFPVLSEFPFPRNLQERRFPSPAPGLPDYRACGDLCKQVQRWSLGFRWACKSCRISILDLPIPLLHPWVPDHRQGIEERWRCVGSTWKLGRVFGGPELESRESSSASEIGKWKDRRPGGWVSRGPTHLSDME